MFDYKALYEIQLQVSVDFLRVVQYRIHRHDYRELLRLKSLWHGEDTFAGYSESCEKEGKT